MSQSRDYYRSLTSGEARGVLAGLQRGGLSLLSIPYATGICARNWLFDRGWKKSLKALVPVVSVGNLTLGGTGKTPCVEYLAGFYRQQDVRVVILSRGYGGNGHANDEALVLADNLPDVPHLQGADRVALAEIAVEELESEVIVLDDGFQHRRLKRDLDVVLIDCTNPWGHGRLFPRGWLREPASSLRRAGLVLLTRCDQVAQAERDAIKQKVRRFQPQDVVVETSHRPVEMVNVRQQTIPLDQLRGRPVAAFCGLGNPESFRRTLADLGAQVTDFRCYPDHHAYARADVESLQSWARRQPAESIVVTTQKDLVKIRLDRLDARALWAVRIRLQVVNGEEVLQRKLAEVLPVLGNHE